MTHLFLWPLSHDFIACWHFHDDTSWKSLKKHLYRRTHIYSFVTLFDFFSAPLEIYLSQVKLSKRCQSLKMPKSALKWDFLMYTRVALRKPTCCTWLVYIILKCTLKTWLFALQLACHMWLFSLQPACIPWTCGWCLCNPHVRPKDVKKIFFSKFG